MSQLSWQKCLGNEWALFLTIDLAQSHFDSMEGVYVIWQGNGPIIRIGQGIIKDRIADHRTNGAITTYNNLYVTWTPVHEQYRDGVERYLADTLNPRVGDAFPSANPIPVKLPWPWQA